MQLLARINKVSLAFRREYIIAKESSLVGEENFKFGTLLCHLSQDLTSWVAIKFANISNSQVWVVKSLGKELHLRANLQILSNARGGQNMIGNGIGYCLDTLQAIHRNNAAELTPNLWLDDNNSRVLVKIVPLSQTSVQQQIVCSQHTNGQCLIVKLLNTKCIPAQLRQLRLEKQNLRQRFLLKIFTYSLPAQAHYNVLYKPFLNLGFGVRAQRNLYTNQFLH